MRTPKKRFAFTGQAAQLRTRPCELNNLILTSRRFRGGSAKGGQVFNGQIKLAVFAVLKIYGSRKI